MTTVVTGASGLLGHNLVRLLLDEGRTVRALDREFIAFDGLDAETVTADIRHPDALRPAFEGADVVYHLAALISLSRDDAHPVHETNVVGTRNVARACLAAGVRRMVHISSIHALSALPLDEPIDETRPLTTDDDCLPYDRSKAAGEQEVRAAVADGLDAVIVNPTSFIGPHDYRPSHMGGALLKLARGKLPMLFDGGFDWVDVRDVAQGALAAEKRGRTGESYLLSGRWCSLRDLGRMVAEAAGVPAPRLHLPLWLARLALPFFAIGARLTRRPSLYTRDTLDILQRHRLVCHDKATRELGYEPRPLEATIRDTVAWLRDNAHRLVSGGNGHAAA